MTKEKDLMEGMFGVLGFSFSGNGQNQVLVFVRSSRTGRRPPVAPDQKVKAIPGPRDGRVHADTRMPSPSPSPAGLPPWNWAMPPVSADVRVVDRAGLGHGRALMGARNQLLGMASQNPAVTKVRPNGLDDMPEYRISIDQEKASALGLSLASINASLSTIWGSTYVNDFIDKGRVKKVFVQGDAPFRMLPEDGHEPLTCISQMRKAGWLPFSRFLQRRSGRWVHPSWSGSTVRPPCRFWANRRRATVPARRCRPSSR